MRAALKCVRQAQIEGVEGGVVVGCRNGDQDVIAAAIPRWNRRVNAGGDRIALTASVNELGLDTPTRQTGHFVLGGAWTYVRRRTGRHAGPRTPCRARS